MTPATALIEPLTETPPVGEEENENGLYPPLTGEARALAEWYASEEFDRQLLAVFEKARQAAIASNPPSPAR